MLVRGIFIAVNMLLLAFGSSTLLRQSRGAWRVVVITLSTLGMLAGFGTMVMAGRLYPVLIDAPAATILFALPWALGTAFVCAFLSAPAQRLRNPFGTLNPWLAPAVFALTLCAFLMLGAGWHRLANGLLDEGPGRAVNATVTGSQGNIAYVVWEDGRQQDLPIRALSRYAPGTHLVMHIRPGYYGMPWAAGWKESIK